MMPTSIGVAAQLEQRGASTAQIRKAQSLAALKERLDQLEAEQLDAVANRDSRRAAVDRGFMGNSVGSPAWDLYASDTNRQGEIARLRDALKGGSGELDYRAGFSDTIEQSPAPPPSRPSPSVQALGQRTFLTPSSAGGSDGELRFAEYQRAMAEATAGTERAKAAGFKARASTAPELEYHQRKATEQWDREAEQAENEAQLQMRGRTQQQDQDISDEAFFSPRGEAERKAKYAMATDPARTRAEGTVQVQNEKNKALLQKALIDAEAKMGSAAVSAVKGAFSMLDSADPQFDARAKMIFDELSKAQAGGDQQTYDLEAQGTPDPRAGSISAKIITDRATARRLDPQKAIEAYRRLHPNVTITP